MTEGLKGTRGNPDLRLLYSDVSQPPAEHIEVHRRVCPRHPELSKDDIRAAWKNSFLSMPRISDGVIRRVSIGQDSRGRLLEMIAQRIGHSIWLVYHAMTPPSKKTLKELRAFRREK